MSNTNYKEKKRAWFSRRRVENDSNVVCRSLALCSLFWSPVLSVSLLAMFSLLVSFRSLCPCVFVRLFCPLWYSSVVLYLSYHSFSSVSIFSSSSFCVCFYFVFRLSVCQFISWFSSFFCGLLLECSVFGAVAVEDGDLCKGVPAIGWRLIFSWGDELSKFTGCYCCRLEAGVQLCYGWWGMVLWLHLWWVTGQPLCYSCWVTDLPWQWFMDWCSHLVELLPWGEESWSSANWDVEELATVEKKLRPSVMDQWSVMVLGWR